MKMLSLGLLLITSFAFSADQYLTYDASSAVSYAKANYNKSYGSGSTKNPFTDYGYLDPGGNCTNFISQCIMAGFVKSSNPSTVFSRRYDFDIDFNSGASYAWYFRSDGERGPAWTGAHKLREYAIYNKLTYKGLHFQYVTHDTEREYLDLAKIKVGDVIFADWNYDGIIDHSMIVTKITSLAVQYNKIRVTYQSNNRCDVGLGDLNILYNYDALFYVYRPIDYNPSGL